MTVPTTQSRPSEFPKTSNRLDSPPRVVAESSGGGSFCPDVPPPAAVESPLARAHRKLRSAENDLGHMNQKLQRFMRDHTAYCGARLVIIGRKITDGPRLGAELANLLRERDRVRETVMAAMKEFAAAKAEAKK